MRTDMKQEDFEKIINGKEKGLISAGNCRLVKQGEELTIILNKKPSTKYTGIITKKETRSFDELTEKDARLVGCRSLKELKHEITSIYGGNPNNRFSIIHFS